jgi:uncharacterized protein
MARSAEMTSSRAKARPEPEPTTPGEVCDVTVPMSITSTVSPPGHRIRSDASGSESPHHDRDPDIRGVISSAALEDVVVADTAVHHGGARPSRLVLPITNR